MFRNTENSETYGSPKLLGGWLLWIFKLSQIILHSSINQHKQFMTNKYQNTTLINNNCQKIQTIKNTLGNSLETDRMLTINLAM